MSKIYAINSRLKTSLGKLTTSGLFYFKMSRPIKFRVWNTKEKKYFIQGDNQRIDLALEYFELTKHVCWPEQFTGLKDHKGNDVYEGDICLILYTDWPSNSSDMPLDEYLKSISHKGIIEYHDFSFYIMIKNRYDELSKNSIDFGKHGRIEVIGNIHENRELLNT